MFTQVGGVGYQMREFSSEKFLIGYLDDCRDRNSNCCPSNSGTPNNTILRGGSLQGGRFFVLGILLKTGDEHLVEFGVLLLHQVWSLEKVFRRHG